MGYRFETTESSHALDDWQLAQISLVMLEAGALGGERVFGNERFAPAPQTLPAGLFTAGDGTHVSAPQCEFVATRLRAALSADLIGDMRMFYPDLSTQLGDWVTEFAAFNELATARGGYRVR